MARPLCLAYAQPVKRRLQKPRIPKFPIPIPAPSAPCNLTSLQEALGAGIAIGNFGILGLQGALGAGIGIGNFGILGLQGALGAGSGIGNFRILGLQRALGAGIGIGNFGILGLCNLRFTG